MRRAPDAPICSSCAGTRSSSPTRRACCNTRSTSRLRKSTSASWRRCRSSPRQVSFATAGLATETVHVLEFASPMHDIGKIGIPDAVLLKRGPLNADEDATMKNHPRMGYDILKGSPSKYLSMGAIIALGHHEKYDGSGYPNGLHGEDIPIVARVVAVADVFDALVSARPYKHAWSFEEAFAYLEAQKGKHFDPRCVEAFVSAGEKVGEILKQFGDA